MINRYVFLFPVKSFPINCVEINVIKEGVYNMCFKFENIENIAFQT